ncbi:hypothetical protein [Ahrensia marina]|uniref:Uncharacterized protein n=1 Tax=Ahrensia marina TaxID=1514904 RepID=A0A0N0VKV6_9HYPH|nr:hypothetical protein [Ahrensia marina]KPA99860.1 hypothetical protein SU32_16925 [Ahrensia marina]
MLGPENAIWDDGEWVSWDDINRQIKNQEWRAKYPQADIHLIPIFEELLRVAEDYHRTTDSHLQVYGDIGELYGAITYGIKLHSNYAQGSDGRLGNDYIEVKTISPFKRGNDVFLNMTRHFSKVLLVKINEDFEIAHKLIARADLPKSKSVKLRINWNEY